MSKNVIAETESHSLFNSVHSRRIYNIMYYLMQSRKISRLNDFATVKHTYCSNGICIRTHVRSIQNLNYIYEYEELINEYVISFYICV